MFQPLLGEIMEPMMGKEIWLNFIFHLVLQWILSEIFMSEIIVQSGWSIQQVWIGQCKKNAICKRKLQTKKIKAMFQLLLETLQIVPKKMETWVLLCLIKFKGFILIQPTINF